MLTMSVIKTKLTVLLVLTSVLLSIQYMSVSAFHQADFGNVDQRQRQTGLVGEGQISLAVLQSSYFGGSAHDFIHFLALDGQGNSIVAGTTSSANFPLSIQDQKMN